MKHDDKIDDIAWIELPARNSEPEEGYEEWLEASIERGLADERAGRVASLSEVKREFGLDP